MAEKKNKKGLNLRLFAIVTSIVLAVVLIVLSAITVRTKYTAFSPEEVAKSYVDGIVQTGDGYNAYKTTLVSKNQKYGDFVINAYMAPYVNDGEDVKQAEFVGEGNDKEQEAIDSVYNTMYDFYVELIKTYGYDNYDAIFDNYFKKLVEVRHTFYKDDYMDTEYMFGVFESNVQTYANSLTGTQNVFASDNKTFISEYTVGAYQEKFGREQEVEVEVLVDTDSKKVLTKEEAKDKKNVKKETRTEKQPVYKLVSEVKECKELSEKETKEYVEAYSNRIKPLVKIGKAKADSYSSKFDEDTKKAMIEAYEKLDCTDDITSVAKAVVEVKYEKNEDKFETVATQEVYLVKIGATWYVDNTNIDTSSLYLALK